MTRCCRARSSIRPCRRCATTRRESAAGFGLPNDTATPATDGNPLGYHAEVPTEILTRAARSLAETRLRTALTVSGIAIGIAALFSLMSIAEGIRTRVVNEWLSSGLMTSLSVTPEGGPAIPGRRGGGPMRGPRGGRQPRSSEPHRALDDDAMKEISALPGVRRVWPVIAKPVEITAEKPRSGAAAEGVAGSPKAGAATSSSSPTAATPGGSDSFGAKGSGSPASDRVQTSEAGPNTETVALRGLDTDFFWNEDYIRIIAGSPLTDPDGSQALLSSERAKGLGFDPPASAVGHEITIRWKEAVPEDSEGAERVPGIPFALATRSSVFKVAGVYENRGALSLRAAGAIVTTARARAISTLDLEKLRALFLGGAQNAGYPGLDVYLYPGADLEAVESKIKAMGFQTLSGAEIVSRIKRSILFLQAFLAGLAAIAIAVATLGIVNTLITAVFERMREIGICKAVGARRRDIRRQFFAEAGLIGASGGVLGVIAGYLADHVLTIVLREFVRRQGGEDPGAVAVHTLGITLGCVAFSIGLSLLAGTYPAARAARLDPVVTLRHE